ncbi:MAG: insulinase family protein [Phenylobacterium sp.]
MLQLNTIARRLGAIAAAVVVAVSLAAPPAAADPVVWTHEASDLKPHPRATFGRLPNGFRYVILPNAVPKGGASIRLRMDVGSLNEAEDERGLAHFLEHMAFAGSKHAPQGEMFRVLERMGVRKGEGINAFTSATQTFYSLDLPAASEANVAESIRLLREIGDLTLAEGAIDAERLTVLNEKRMNDGPSAQLNQAQTGFWFQGRRAADRLPIGTDAVIAKAPYAKIRDFYRRYYRPERAVLIVVGDVKPAQLEPRIRALFADWQGQGPDGAEPDLGAPGRRGADARVVVEPALPPRIIVSWIRPYDPSPQSMASIREMMFEYLGLGVLNSRLERQAAGANPPFAAAASQREIVFRSGEVTELQATSIGDQAAALRALVLAQRQLLQYGVTQAELDVEVAEWRSRLENRAYGTLTEPSSRLADEIVQTLEENGVFTSSEQDIAIFNEVVKDITPEKVNSELRRAFSGEGPLTLVVATAPVAPETVLAAVQDAERQSVSAPSVKAQAWPYQAFGPKGEVASRRRVADLDATFVQFRNGARLTVKPTKIRTGQVLVTLRAGRGRMALPADRSAPDWATTALAMGGLGKLPFEDLTAALPGKVVSINPQLADDAFEFDGATRAQDLDAQLQLMAAYLTDAAWRPEAFERFRAQMADNMLRTDSTPGRLMQRQVKTLMRGGDRRWALPTPAEVAAAGLPETRAAIEAAFAGPLELTIVGDVELEAAIESAARTFGALPARPGGRPAEAGAPRFPRGAAAPVVLRHVGSPEQSYSMAAWAIPGYFADPKETRVLRVLEQVLANRMFDRIRAQQGLAYATGTELVSSDVFSGYGYLMAMAEARPADSGKVFASIDQIVADLKAKAVDADELERARRPRVEDDIAARQSNGWWLSVLSGAWDDPRRLDIPRQGAAAFQAITAADLRRAAQRHLTDANVWKAQILPVGAVAQAQ